MPSALITGITGQDGLYLAEHLLAKGYDVYGLIRGQNNPKYELVARTVPGVTLLTGDLGDLSSLLRALETSQPQELYNLAAISFVAYSWENARVTSEVTGMGVLNVLEALRLYSRGDMGKVRFYQASSSEMFGKVQQVPQDEQTLLWPRSPYGVSKVYGHYMTMPSCTPSAIRATACETLRVTNSGPRRGDSWLNRIPDEACSPYDSR